MQLNNIKGFLSGLLSSASFGLIPLFAVPVMRQGMGFDSVLFYRFFFACIALGCFLLVTRQTFRITLRQLRSLILLAVFYDLSALFLFWGYTFMASGVATTIHFMYPVLTTLIMMIFFGEKKSFYRILAVVLAVGGVFCLSCGDTANEVSLIGTFIVLLSALAYALYLVAVNQLHLDGMGGLKLTFYVFLIGGALLLIFISFNTGLQPIEDWETGQSLILLALIPTVVSNLALVQSLKYIGSTLTSVLGAMEPVTAVFVGITVFGEALTAHTTLGILLIISAVLIIIVHRSFSKCE